MHFETVTVNDFSSLMFQNAGVRPSLFLSTICNRLQWTFICKNKNIKLFFAYIIHQVEPGTCQAIKRGCQKYYDVSNQSDYGTRKFFLIAYADIEYLVQQKIKEYSVTVK